MSNLPNGLDKNAMIAVGAWEIVNYVNLCTACFSDRLSEEVIVKTTNELFHSHQAIYLGKSMENEKK